MWAESGSSSSTSIAWEVWRWNYLGSKGVLQMWILSDNGYCREFRLPWVPWSYIENTGFALRSWKQTLGGSGHVHKRINLRVKKMCVCVCNWPTSENFLYNLTPIDSTKNSQPSRSGFWTCLAAFRKSLSVNKPVGFEWIPCTGGVAILEW